MKAATLVRLTRHVPKPVLRLATRRPTRRLVLGQVFKRMPELLSPAGRKANGVIRFDITSGETWFVALGGGGRCEVTQRHAGTPRVTIILSAFDFVQIATGADPVRLFTAGKVRMAGDTYFGASLAELFDLPR
jgi:hypothetical protein